MGIEPVLQFRLDQARSPQVGSLGLHELQQAVTWQLLVIVWTPGSATHDQLKRNRRTPGSDRVRGFPRRP